MGTGVYHGAAELPATDNTTGDVFVESIRCIERTGNAVRVYFAVTLGNGPERRQEIVARIIIPTGNLDVLAHALSESARPACKGCHPDLLAS